MSTASSLEILFSESSLNIVIPDTAFELPQPFSPDGSTWLASITSQREVAFFDEHLHILLCISLPNQPPENQATSLLAPFLERIQVAVDATYIPSSSNGQQLSQRIQPLQPRYSLAGQQPPLTPNPVPASSPSDRAGDTTGHNVALCSLLWPTKMTGSETDRRRFTIIKAETGVVVIYRLEVTIAFVPTRFQDSLLSLTLSATFRDTALPDLPRQIVSQALQEQSATVNTSHIEESISRLAASGSEDASLDAVMEINLLDGLLDPQSENERRLSFSTARLSDTMRRHLFSLPVPSSSEANGQASAPQSAVSGTNVLKKAFRKILKTVSGVRVRMRTTFVPYMELDGDPTDRRDAGIEEKTVILSVEVENVQASGKGFEIEQIEVFVGPERLHKAKLLPWRDDIFPLRLKSNDIYNFLYAVSASSLEHAGGSLWPSGNSIIPANTRISDSHTPMAILVTGRPWTLSSDDKITPPTPSFTSRWSSVLDLVATGSLERPPSPSVEWDTLPMPSSPFPLSSTRGMDAVSLITGGPGAPQNSPSGPKRHTFAGQGHPSPKSRVGYLSGAAQRASTPVPLPPNPRPQSSQPGSHMSITVPSSPAGPPTGPATPAFPSYTGSEVNTPQSPTIHNPVGSGSPIEPRKQKMVSGPLPPTPRPGSVFAQSNRASQPQAESINTLLVSVSLIKPRQKQNNTDEEEENTDSDGEPDDGNRRILPMDEFALEIFVLNKSNRVRSFEISYPDRKRWRKQHPQTSVRDSKVQADFTPDIGVVPIDNNIQIGPMAPGSCQSIRMQFVALRKGVHAIDALSLRDLDSDQVTNLRSVMHIVVKAEQVECRK